MPISAEPEDAAARRSVPTATGTNDDADTADVVPHP
jgi:hypothetical protein